MNPELLRLLAGIQARRRGMGPTTALESLFVGQDDPRAPFGVNEQARRGALTEAGLTGFLALGEGGGLLDVIGATGLAGRSARERITEDLIKPIDLETEIVKLDNGRTILVNKKTGEIIADLGGEAPEEPLDPDFGTPQEVILPNGDRVFGVLDRNRGIFIDPNTGQPLVGVRPVGPDPKNAVFRKRVDPNTGITFEFAADPLTGNPLPGGATYIVDIPDATANEKNMLAGEMQRQLDAITSILSARGNRPFGLIESLAEKSDILRGITSTEMQTFRAAADNIITAVVKSREGGRPSDKDREFFANFIVPRVGDSPETVLFKLDNIQTIIDDMRAGDSNIFDSHLARFRRQGVPGPRLEGNRFGDLVPR